MPDTDRRPTAPFGQGRMRRLFGLDRTAPSPRETRKGEPLHPWTIPNVVGFLRLIGIPVFCYLAFSSGDGRTPPAAILYWLIAAGDYVDGLLARVTGQYSRLGALMDPVIDRLTILTGASVCWYFELLPRWALALLALRELATLGLAQYGLRQGVDLEINWLGRAAVFPVMSAIFFAMVFDGWVPTALLIIGLVLGIIATALYWRMGQDAAKARDLALAHPGVETNPPTPASTGAND